MHGVAVGPSLAVQRLRDDPRKRRLAGAARAGEQVRLANLVALDRVAKRAHDRLLPDDLVEVERAVLPVERGHEVMLTRAGSREGCSCPSAG